VNKTEISNIFLGKSRKKAIHIFCRECMGYDGHRVKKPHMTYQEANIAVANCKNKKCSLFPYRKEQIEPVIVDWL